MKSPLQCTQMSQQKQMPDYLRCSYDCGERDFAKLKYPEFLHSAIEPVNFGKNFDATAWFFCIMDELQKDASMTWMGVKWYEFILQAWRENRLLGLSMPETDLLYNLSCATMSKYFMYSITTGRCQCVLPCFLVTSKEGREPDSGIDTGNSIEFMWVAPRVRRMGLGGTLDQKYNHGYVHQPVDDALPFWHAMGYTEETKPAKK